MSSPLPITALICSLASSIEKAETIAVASSSVGVKNGALIAVEGEDEKRNKRTFVEASEAAV